MQPHRLEQLRRQKELILQQLDWINQEIDRESIAATPSSSPKVSRLLETVAIDKPVSDRLTPSDPESMPQGKVVSDLYDQLGPDTKSAVTDTRRGCMLFAALAFSLLAASFLYIAFFY